MSESITMTLGELCVLKAGKFVAAKDIFNETHQDLYPCYGGNGIRGYVSEYSHDGEFPLIGRQGALCGNVNYATGKFRATEHAIVVQPRQNTHKKWLYYALTAMNLGQYATGAAQPGLSVVALEKITISVPNLQRQKVIADTFTLIEKLISLRKQQLEKLDELVKSRFVEMFESSEYEKVTVSSVLDVGFWLMPATPEFITDGDVPYITSKNIKNRTIDFDNVKYISREAYKSISANRPTRKGDILVSMIGTLGQTAVIQDAREFYGQNLYLLRLNSSIIDTTYFCEFFNSDAAQHELLGKRNQSTQAYLKANHVEDLVLPLLPMKLQQQFAAFVEQTDKSKLAIQQSLDKLETLKKALVQKYFG